MLCALVDLELGGHLAAELGLGKHALDGLLDDGFGATGEELDEGLFAETAGESGVAAIELLVSLQAGEDDLLGVDDDDVIAHIDVGGVEGVELAGENEAACVARRPRVLPLASSTNHLRLMSLPLGMVVDIVWFTP